MGFIRIIVSWGNIFLVGIFVLAIRAYQKVVSPLLGPSCRFHPSCSSYTITALRKHGIIKGMILASRRIISCSPLSYGGNDPVPETFRFFR